MKELKENSLLEKAETPAGSGTAGNVAKSSLLGKGVAVLRHTVELVRIHHWKDATVGRMVLDGSLECYTLEPPVTGVPHPCIAAGRYRLDLRPSARFHRPMLHLEDRYGRSGILIHAGNTASDTHGCILLGESLSDPSAEGSGCRLVHSALACQNFYRKVWRGWGAERWTPSASPKAMQGHEE